MRYTSYSMKYSYPTARHYPDGIAPARAG